MPRTNPPKFALWLSDAALYDQFKAEAARRGQSLKDAAAAAVDLYLHPPVVASEPADPAPPTVRAKVGKALADKGLPPAILANALQDRLPTNPERLIKVTLPDPFAAICRRCTHPRASHWSRGCLAGCTCTEARFQD